MRTLKVNGSKDAFWLLYFLGNMGSVEGIAPDLEEMAVRYSIYFSHALSQTNGNLPVHDRFYFCWSLFWLLVLHLHVHCAFSQARLNANIAAFHYRGTTLFADAESEKVPLVRQPMTAEQLVEDGCVSPVASDNFLLAIHGATPSTTNSLGVWSCLARLLFVDAC